jgi:hypothetical protein
VIWYATSTLTSPISRFGWARVDGTTSCGGSVTTWPSGFPGRPGPRTRCYARSTPGSVGHRRREDLDLEDTLPLAPAGARPISQVYSLPTVVALQSGSTAVNSVPPGAVTLTTVFRASPGPAFATVTVTGTVSPTCPWAGVAEILKSAGLAAVYAENGRIVGRVGVLALARGRQGGHPITPRVDD